LQRVVRAPSLGAARAYSLPTGSSTGWSIRSCVPGSAAVIDVGAVSASSPTKPL